MDMHFETTIHLSTKTFIYKNAAAVPVVGLEKMELNEDKKRGGGWMKHEFFF